MKKLTLRIIFGLILLTYVLTHFLPRRAHAEEFLPAAADAPIVTQMTD